MLHPENALWTVLQFVPPTDSSGPPLAQQQLRVAATDLLLAEQRARNAIKGSGMTRCAPWSRYLSSPAQVMPDHKMGPLWQLCCTAGPDSMCAPIA